MLKRRNKNLHVHWPDWDGKLLVGLPKRKRLLEQSIEPAIAMANQLHLLVIFGQLKEESTSADGGITGQYSYVNPDGQQITVSYVAGKDGFRASENHLPLAPQLPTDLAQAYAEANGRLCIAHEEARSRTQTYEDGSYKYQPDEFSAAAQPIPYNTYVSEPDYAFPVQNSYTYEAPSYPEPKPVYSSSSYPASVGGEAKVYSPTPAVVPVKY
ncbi:hypothetical protein CHUAL_013506 [Chamberlinius hualienensis]